ncbi:MAG: N-acetyltransferase [Pseudohongiella sp.]|nr:N-acetyltransferase [Pseudohongiella sp.]
MTIEIKALTRQTMPILGEHFKRHRAESGTNGVHFMPFAPDDTNGPTGATVDRSFWPIDKPGWQRWFCIHELATGNIVGHVDLKTDPLRAGTHWCHLGIGIESAYRGRGLGGKLMDCAIAYAKSTRTIDFIELRVFSNNLPALALYKKKGFVEIGTLKDRFRLQGQSIDDTIMVLDVRGV